MTAGVATTGLAHPWLNVLRNTSASAVAQPYFQVHTGDPGSAGTANISVGSTTRVAASYAAPSAGSMSQTGASPVWTNGGATEILTHASAWSALTSGTFLYSFQLSASQAWASTQTYTLATYSFAFIPIAA